jgi:hypothetical protein
VSLLAQRRRQPRMVLAPRYLDRAEALQMRGDELGIEQLETAAA